MNNYFDFLEQNSTPAPTETTPVVETCDGATITVRVDADCEVICDGDLLMTVKAGQASKQKIGLGQHLLQFVSIEASAAIIEQILDCQENGKNHIILVDSLRRKIDSVNQERKVSFNEIDFIAKYVDTTTGYGGNEFKKEIGENQIHDLLKNEIMPAINFGNPAAHYVMYLMLWNGIGMQKERETAVTRLRYAAENGVAWAQNDLGKHYGSKGDYGKAIEWFLKAAEQGNSVAQYNLGDCYLRGNGVQRDKDKALKWITKAAEQGNPQAQHELECFDMNWDMSGIDLSGLEL